MSVSITTTRFWASARQAAMLATMKVLPEFDEYEVVPITSGGTLSGSRKLRLVHIIRIASVKTLRELDSYTKGDGSFCPLIWYLFFQMKLRRSLLSGISARNGTSMFSSISFRVRIFVSRKRRAIRKKAGMARPTRKANSMIFIR